MGAGCCSCSATSAGAISQAGGDDVGSVMQRLRQQQPAAQRVTVNVNVQKQTGAQVAVLANAVQQ